MNSENGESNQCNDGKTHDVLHVLSVGFRLKAKPATAAPCVNRFTVAWIIRSQASAASGAESRAR
jgi:hypothetical protein